MVHSIKFSLFLLALSAATLGRAEDAPCVANIDDGDLVKNYTGFAPMVRNETPAGNRAFYDKYYKNPTDADNARSLLADLFNKPWIRQSTDRPGTRTNCAPKMKDYLATNTPDIYIYVGGYGQQVQLNDTYIDAAEVVKWVNKKDPQALVISLGWSCEDAVLAGETWCREKAKEYIVPDDHVIFQNLFNKTTASSNKDILAQLKGAALENGRAYNESLTHSLEMSGYLINLLLAASSESPDKGKIHFIGYSLGAQVVTEIMTFDYSRDSNDRREGFPWSVRGVCEDGKGSCHVSELKKVKWALAMGTPGWSQALRNSYNDFSESTGKSSRDESDRLEYENGGLFRVQDKTYQKFVEGGTFVTRNLVYKKKLVIFNKRYDPTAVADDSYQRGIGSSFLAEYNHYGHDYNRPYFWNKAWTSTVEKFLENSNAKDSKEWGIIWEAGANFDFDDCADASCNPASTYAIHAGGLHNHSSLLPMRPKDAVRIIKTDESNKAVAFETSSDVALQAYAMDQEDLRGSVEFSWMPKFELNDKKVHGLFSYGSCNGSKEDLMPQAYVENGALVFEVRYKGNPYSARVESALLAKSVKKGEWSHVSFAWNLPTRPMSESPLGALFASQYKDGYFFAAGLLKAPRTSMRTQQGVGSLRIYINGKAIAGNPLGDADNGRECLAKEKVVSSQKFDLADGTDLVAYNPYDGYNGNAIANPFTGSGSIGTVCKVYSVRNSPVFFGCAKSDGVNAASDMDNVRIIFGSPRTSFPEISESGGLPKPWTEVLGI